MMTKKFENKKLNKDDHAKVDKEADIVRGGLKVAGTLGVGFVILQRVPWKKVGGTIGKVVFKV